MEEMFRLSIVESQLINLISSRLVHIEETEASMAEVFAGSEMTDWLSCRTDLNSDSISN